MPKLLACLVCAFALLTLPANAQANLLAPHNGQPQLLFWMGNGNASVESFMAHKDKIGILSPTWYSIDTGGLVSGEPEPVVLKAAKAEHMTLLPLFALFSADKAHVLVNDTHAQDEMIRGFLRECKEWGYAGINIDIEDVMWTDRDGMSSMVQRVSDALHKEGLLVSIDVVPPAPGHPGETSFSRWIYSEWRGGYDLHALGNAVDLLCLMTYDQHTHWTTPGPVGGWLWTNENLAMALKEGVPAAKLSLGIAAYGYHWYTGDPGLNKKEKTPNVTSDYISAATAHHLRDTYGAKEQWDDVDHEPWFYFNRDDMREWVFYTDRRSFMDRVDLARTKGLEGVCSWVLGEEDPAIWAALPKAR